MRISDWSSDVCSSDLAAAATARPFVLSFTVETDGRLPTGDPLGAAIEVVDAATEGYPAYYMINCAHPTHFATTLDEETDWVARIRGIRANASRCSHAELDAMTALDAGDPRDLALRYRGIGSATGRARVCQSVDISVVAGT